MQVYMSSKTKDTTVPLARLQAVLPPVVRREGRRGRQTDVLLLEEEREEEDVVVGRWAANRLSVGPHAGGVSLVYGLMENK
jgi:hypothetical protein